MKFGTPEIIIIVTLFIVLLFTIVRAKHYFYSRKYEDHDSYITVVEKDGGIKNVLDLKCGDLK